METICIVGGGLGGLALAHALVRECPEKKVVILERDESAVSRSQGIVIGVQQEGIDALVRLGGEPVVAELQRLLQKDGPADVRIMDKTGATLVRGREWLAVTLAGEPRCALADRAVLRTVLATSLPEGVIHWNSRVSALHANDSGVWVECADGNRIRAHLVIGADGYRSQVRTMRCPRLAPEDLGVWQTAGLFPCPESSGEPELFKHARTSLVRMNGDLGLSLLMFITTAPPTPNSPPAVPRCLWSLSVPSTFAQQHNLTSSSDLTAMREKLIQLMIENFHCPAAVDAVRRTEIEGLMPPYEMNSVKTELLKLPCPLNEKSESWRVMLMGDALHKTTTQAGLGATAAFKDAESIFEMIRRSKSGGITQAAVQQCNSKMWKEAAYVVNMSVGNTKRLHSVPGPAMAAMAPCLMRSANGVLSMIYYGRKGLRQLKRPEVAVGLLALLGGVFLLQYIPR